MANLRSTCSSSPGRVFSYRRTGRRGARGNRLRPVRCSSRCTVPCPTPTSSAIRCTPQPKSRATSMASCTSAGCCVGDRCGRRLRGCNPARSASWYRRHQRDRTGRAIPCRTLKVSNGTPASCWAINFARTARSWATPRTHRLLAAHLRRNLCPGTSRSRRAAL